MFLSLLPLNIWYKNMLNVLFLQSRHRPWKRWHRVYLHSTERFPGIQGNVCSEIWCNCTHIAVVSEKEPHQNPALGVVWFRRYSVREEELTQTSLARQIQNVEVSERESWITRRELVRKACLSVWPPLDIPTSQKCQRHSNVWNRRC